MKYQVFFAEYFPFWHDLDASDRDFLCQNTTEEYFEKEQPVHDNLGCSGLYIVKTGRLRLYMLSEDGKEITLYRLMPGDICMLSASCVLQSITFDVFVDAEEPSECCVISGSAFAAVSERNSAVKIFALETAVGRFSDVMWVMQQILFMSMDKRLAIFLLDEAAVIGQDTLPLTHEQIARYMGSAREVVSRMLKYFSAEGMVEVSRKGVRLLDKARLRKLAV